MSANSDEFARQRALDIYHVVDSLPEAAYEDIVRLASILCDAPIALISLIDRERQWFKARVGFELTGSSRDVAFCDHAIRVPGQLMEIPDANNDPRFAGNPLVTGEQSIRFYAGMPLVTPGGAPIGTVCVLDHEPRALNESQRAGMASLARLTMNLLEARHRERALLLSALFTASPDAVASHVPEPPEAGDCTIAIFEVQDLAGAADRSGERAVMRALQQLHQSLEAGLRPGSGDNISHSTGSAEMIVVLHGSDTAATLMALHERLPAFEREHALCVLSGSAHSDFPSEPLESIFLRADTNLTHAKDKRSAEAIS